MGQVVAHEPLQDGFGLGGAEAQGGGILDHFVILSTDQIPVDRTGEDRLEIGIMIGVTGAGTIELL